MAKRFLLTFTALFIASQLFVAQLWAIPGFVNFQGRLLDDGIPVTTTGQAFTVNIYTMESGGSPIYTESHSEDVDDGTYNLEIGNGSSQSPTYSTSIFDTVGELWLEIVVGAETLTPRHQLLSGPFSLNSEMLQGNLPSDFATPTDIQTLLTQVKNLCLQSGGGWNDTTSTCSTTVSTTAQALPSGSSFIPLSTLNSVSGPDNCADSHYHGTGTDCDNQTVFDPDPSACGHGTVFQVVSINTDGCLALQ